MSSFDCAQKTTRQMQQHPRSYVFRSRGQLLPGQIERIAVDFIGNLQQVQKQQAQPTRPQQFTKDDNNKNNIKTIPNIAVTTSDKAEFDPSQPIDKSTD